MSLRKAISNFLVTLPNVFIKPANDSPPLPDLSELEKKGIPILHTEHAEEEYTKLVARRKLLLSLIRDDGWEWSDLQAGSFNHELKLNKDGHYN
ncbi:MAG: hypothetical protein JJE09_05175 [Bacteroidia bacterium]|nr:hypothetical protein [Bacteroidia bacterium]